MQLSKLQRLATQVVAPYRHHFSPFFFNRDNHSKLNTERVLIHASGRSCSSGGLLELMHITLMCPQLRERHLCSQQQSDGKADRKSSEKTISSMMDDLKNVTAVFLIAKEDLNVLIISITYIGRYRYKIAIWIIESKRFIERVLLMNMTHQKTHGNSSDSAI